jgi:kynurenine formamidase
MPSDPQVPSVIRRLVNWPLVLSWRCAALLAMGGVAFLATRPQAQAQSAQPPLWQLYQQSFKGAKYIDLTHTITPDATVWKGFGPSRFGPSLNPATGKPYTFKDDGFEATRYELSTDQLGTQLDPPAHWNPNYPGIDELPATFTLRPLVVINTVPKVEQDPGYQAGIEDIQAWEQQHGPIPEGSVVFFRSDWSKKWGQPGLADDPVFPGVKLDALKFLHLQRHILFHGHEALDTDTTPTLEGEAWLLQNGYTQAEGVANLDQVPESGALVAIGYPKFGGGVGGYARFVAIAPAGWKYGVTIAGTPDSPLPKAASPLVWDEARGMRVRR